MLRTAIFSNGSQVFARIARHRRRVPIWREPLPFSLRPPHTRSSDHGRPRRAIWKTMPRGWDRYTRRWGARGGRGGEVKKTGKRRRWDFDRPLAPASRAAGRTRTSPRKKGSVLARPRWAGLTLCTARTLNRGPSYPVSWLGRYFILDAAPIRKIHPGTDLYGNRIEFRPLNEKRANRSCIHPFYILYRIILYYMYIFIFFYILDNFLIFSLTHETSETKSAIVF